MPREPLVGGASLDVIRGWGDIAAGVISIAFGAWLVVQTFSFNVTASARVGGGVDAAGYPRLLAVMTITLGLVLLLSRAWAARGGRTNAVTGAEHKFESTPMQEKVAAGSPQAGRAAAAFGILITYTALLEPAGFLIATPVAVVLLLRVIGRRRVVHSIVAALALSTVIFVFFRYGVNIVLPEGLLRGLSP